MVERLDGADRARGDVVVALGPRDLCALRECVAISVDDFDVEGTGGTCWHPFGFVTEHSVTNGDGAGDLGEARGETEVGPCDR